MRDAPLRCMVTHYRAALWLLSMGFGVLLFQNCGQAVNQKAEKSGDLGSFDEQVVGDASSYYKIIYDPILETMGVGINASAPRLELNLQTGQAVVGRPSSQLSCAIPAAELQNLIQILNGAKICKVRIPDGVAVCMAYPMADIELSNDTEKQLLRPAMCAAEVFLCEGRDARLREAIQRLLSSPCGP